MVANEGKNPIHSNGKLFVALGHRHIGIICQNTLVLVLDRDCKKTQSKTESTIALCWRNTTWLGVWEHRLCSFINCVTRDAALFRPKFRRLPFVTLHHANSSPGFYTPLHDVFTSRYRFKLVLRFRAQIRHFALFMCKKTTLIYLHVVFRQLM